MYPDGHRPEELLDSFLALPHETEWLEFKEAKGNFDSNELGKYFSALSNEAVLKGRDFGWLIFGVSDDHSVCGSAYRENPSSLQRLKQEVASQTSGRLTFEEIHVVTHPQGRVVMFQIPPATLGTPTDWKGHWYGRNGESLVPLTLPKLQRILSGSSELTEIDRFESHLMDYGNWRYDGLGTAVYLPNADFVICIEKTEEIYGAGNYWWGSLLHEKPTALWYRLVCKQQEVDKVLALLYRNELLTVPFPKIETVAYPGAVRSSPYYADVPYYQRDSIGYKLLCHIRAVEVGREFAAPTTPVQSPIKPPIIRLPLPIVKDGSEAELLLNLIQQRLDEFESEYASQIASISGGDIKDRMRAEELFSWWAYRLWEAEGRD